eukprot:357381-Chlamydomonas_euryale.AAC.12
MSHVCSSLAQNLLTSHNLAAKHASQHSLAEPVFDKFRLYTHANAGVTKLSALITLPASRTVYGCAVEACPRRKLHHGYKSKHAYNLLRVLDCIVVRSLPKIQYRVITRDGGCLRWHRAAFVPRRYMPSTKVFFPLNHLLMHLPP